MIFSRITSPSNPVVKEVRRLREKRSKYRHDTFLIEGPHVITTALDAGIHIGKVFFSEIFSERKEGKQILFRLSENAAALFEVSDSILKKLTDTEAPQGIAAVASYSPFALDALKMRENPFLVVVDGIQDPGNLGTIIRTSDAAGADAVILLPGTCDAFMPKAIRATAGSLFNIPISYSAPENLLTWLTQRRIRSVATSPDAGRSLFDLSLHGPLAFFLGNESRGLSATLRKSADVTLRIPIFGKAESLNVATASAICLYEAARQRSLGKAAEHHR